MNNCNKFTLLVNSSDGFDDCWEPFFKLLSLNWKNCDIPILLNTEFKEFSYDSLNIKCSKANLSNLKRKLSWSECLINAINQIDTPLVLYMQEDYFIEKNVRVDLIDEFTDLMINNKDIKCIGLTHFGSFPPFYKWQDDEKLLEVSQKSKYRISTQAAIWDKETLLSYLRPNESGWMFEIFGSKRSFRKKELFLTVNRDVFNPNNGTIIEYLHTGIIKGKWHPGVVDLFKNFYINIDFNKRGFYKSQNVIYRKFETSKKLIKNPFYFIRGILGY